MSPVALTLNLTLGVLLIGAMLMGLKLDRRLKALRESHLGFAKAVSELDQASRRTENSLADIRETAEDARTSLGLRIDAARALIERLGPMIAQAEAQAEVLAKQPAGLARPVLLRAAQPAPEPAAPQARPASAPPVRSRAMVDDELFETSRPSLSAFAGGRR